MPTNPSRGLLSLCLILLASNAGGDWRATENVNWTPRRQQMNQLANTAADLRLTLSPELEEKWGEYAAEQQRLFDLALRFDEEERSLHARRASADDWTEFIQRCDQQYNQYVRRWEQELQTLMTLQNQEVSRLTDAWSQSQTGVAPNLEPPPPSIDRDARPRFNEDVRAMQPHVLASDATLRSVLSEVIPLGADVASYSVSAPAAATIQIALASYRALGGAIQAEDAKLAQDMARLRRLPGILSKIQADNRALERDLEAGRITRDEKRRRLGERARALVNDLPGSARDEESRLIDNLFSREAGYEFLSSLGSWAVDLATSKVPSGTSARYIRANDTPLGPARSFFESNALNATEYARFKNRLAAEEIASHAYERHALKSGPVRSPTDRTNRTLGDQWPEIRTREQLASEVEAILNKPGIPRKHIGEGRIAVWDTATDTIVIRDPRPAFEGGTVFRPPPGEAARYYGELREKLPED